MTEDIYVNRVICDGSLLMDISDTTANESDVLKVAQDSQHLCI